ncbi:hypothetical protein Hypma_001170 [Hypsizygus marmoreus]|uniref:Uncharacterized protein n=1 Tax=Hypsizygus marmoreus TaxID=39966 RepID=A0A369JBA4_HYPMA|nr:hypothetical protein Hypma_001170 [Hypsizygus marmoreus]
MIITPSTTPPIQIELAPATPSRDRQPDNCLYGECCQIRLPDGLEISMWRCPGKVGDVPVAVGQVVSILSTGHGDDVKPAIMCEVVRILRPLERKSITFEIVSATGACALLLIPLSSAKLGFKARLKHALRTLRPLSRRPSLVTTPTQSNPSSHDLALESVATQLAVAGDRREETPRIRDVPPRMSTFAAFWTSPL